MPPVEHPPIDTDDHMDLDDAPPQPPEDFDGQGDDGEDGDPVRWVTVATFWQSAAAHIARVKLESEEIDCVIVDENLVSTDWLYANAVGGIKLQVPVPLLQQARDLLSPAAQDGELKEESDEPLFDGQDRCPRCGSDDIQPQLFSRKLAFLSILILAFPLPIFSKGIRCNKCRYEWKPVSHRKASI